MSICFYSAQSPEIVTSKEKFGIQDQGMQIATLIEDSDLDSCECIIINNKVITLNFTPIDKLIPLKKQNGDDDKRCDAMLFIKDSAILFIELKKNNWQDKNGEICERYAEEKLEQLKSTIQHFKRWHPIDFKNRKIIKQAHLTNIIRPHFEFQDIKITEGFESETKFILFTSREITTDNI